MLLRTEMDSGICADCRNAEYDLKDKSNGIINYFHGPNSRRIAKPPGEVEQPGAEFLVYHHCGWIEQVLFPGPVPIL